jgi:cytoskeletal protein RodZ
MNPEMAQLGAALRDARETQQRTLEDIASQTRINRKFLETLERGEKPKLPPTYLRAIVKAFAHELGLDPKPLLKLLEPAEPPPEPPGNSPAPPESTPAHQPPAAPPRTSEGVSQRSSRGRMLMIGLLLAFICLGFISALLWLRDDHKAAAPQEIPFSDIVKEQESKVEGKAVALPDSQQPKVIREIPQFPDSLSLQGVAIDTVWVHVVADSGAASEQILPPTFRKTWKAKNSLRLSVGNGAAISFTLNGERLGKLSPVRKSIKNVLITWETVRKLQAAQGSKR